MGTKHHAILVELNLLVHACFFLKPNLPSLNFIHWVNSDFFCLHNWQDPTGPGQVRVRLLGTVWLEHASAKVARLLCFTKLGEHCCNHYCTDAEGCRIFSPSALKCFEAVFILSGCETDVCACSCVCSCVCACVCSCFHLVLNPQLPWMCRPIMLTSHLKLNWHFAPLWPWRRPHLSLSVLHFPHSFPNAVKGFAGECVINNKSEMRGHLSTNVYFFFLSQAILSQVL